MIYYGNFYPPLERNSGINTKFYKFNLNDSNLDINTLSATNTQESTKNFSYSILTGFQHSGGTSNFDIQMQFADAVAYYLYIWVQK